MEIEMLSVVFELCILPLLIILTKYAIQFINVKTKDLIAKSDSDREKKYITMISNTVADCVIATNQTYVESLKKQGKFDKEAQIVAFNKTKEAVLKILSADAIEYIHETTNDIDVYLTQLIEAQVNKTKK